MNRPMSDDDDEYHNVFRSVLRLNPCIVEDQSLLLLMLNNNLNNVRIHWPNVEERNDANANEDEDDNRSNDCCSDHKSN